MTWNTRIHTVASTCIARQAREIARVLTGVYQEALRPHGLLVSQFNVLVAIAAVGQAEPSDLVESLHLEKSTVSRNVRRLRDQGWIEAHGEGRGIRYTLTASGHELFEATWPDWEQAQNRARELLGADGQEELERLWMQLASCASKNVQSLARRR